jgi:hypothetical protein
MNKCFESLDGDLFYVPTSYNFYIKIIRNYFTTWDSTVISALHKQDMVGARQASAATTLCQYRQWIHGSRVARAQSIQRWATGWTIEVLGFNTRRGLGIFLLTTESRTALGPTQPPIQWVLGALSLEAKRPGREADHSPPSSAEVKEWVQLYLNSPIRLHGVVLSWAQRQLYL